MSEQILIDANDIVKVADHAYSEWNLAMAAAEGQREINLCFKRQDLCRAVAAVAKQAPPIDPETLPIVQELRAELEKRPPVIHAHWIHLRKENTCQCSYCGHRQLYDNYCSRCGATMDEEVGSE